MKIWSKKCDGKGDSMGWEENWDGDIDNWEIKGISEGKREIVIKIEREKGREEIWEMGTMLRER